jgi:hypothetical protein
MTLRSRLYLQTVDRSLYVTSCPFIYGHPTCIAIQHDPSRFRTRTRSLTYTNSTTMLLHLALTKVLSHQTLHAQSTPRNHIVVFSYSCIHHIDTFTSSAQSQALTPTIPISSSPSADATNTGLETASNLTQHAENNTTSTT